MKEKILEIIASVSATDKTPEELGEEMKIIDDLQIDSLGFVHMILILESTFNIKFDDEYINMEKLATVKDVINYVEEKTKK
ncbi:MAG: acyl carrier protein [Alphaproteobacteria bacterium]|nr:acyl carrier protein [Alphaproteobacteria bacterium]